MAEYLEYLRSQILKWRGKSLLCLQRKEAPRPLALLHVSLDPSSKLVVASLPSPMALLISFHFGWVVHGATERAPRGSSF